MKEFAGKRVLMVIENSTYPLDIRAYYESTALINSGYQVTVICQRGKGEPWGEIIKGVRVVRYPAPPHGRSFFSFIFEYAYSFLATFVLSLSVCVSPGFDIIHAANPPDTAVFIAIFYRPFGKKFIFDHHDLTPDLYRAQSINGGSQIVCRILIWLEKISLRFAHHIIATNQSYKNIEIRRGNVPENRISIVRNGPSLERLKLTQSDPELRKRGKVIIGYIGVMGPQDGVDILLRTLNLLVTKLNCKDFFCVIIGKGSMLDKLKTETDRLGLENYVWFTGFIPESEMIRYLSTIDIGVDPDPENGFNEYCTMIKIMEYMSLSKPVVAFDLPEHRVTAGEAALYALPNDELDFAKKIKELMDNFKLRAEMGVIGKQRIVNTLCWSHQKAHLIDAYKKIEHLQ